MGEGQRWGGGDRHGVGGGHELEKVIDQQTDNRTVRDTAGSSGVREGKKDRKKKKKKRRSRRRRKRKERR